MADVDTHFVVSIIAVAVLIAVHVGSTHIDRIGGPRWNDEILSVATGVSVAYVVMQLLPELSKSAATIQHAARSLLPFFERHAYFLTVVGIVVFYANSRHVRQSRERNKSSGASDSASTAAFAASITLNAIFNMMVAYTIANPNDTEIEPIALFVIAIALHYLVADHALHSNYATAYRSYGRWILIGALVIGWGVGYFAEISATALALLVAFFAGGILVTVLSHELDVSKQRRVAAFAIGALGYSVVLMLLRTN